MSSFHESQLEQAFVELFQKEGYDYVYGECILRDTRDVILYDDLRFYLRKKYKTDHITEDEIKEQGFGDYFVDHTTGIFPQAAAGFPYTAASMQVKGDPITDLHESMAAEQKARTTYDNILRFCDDYDVKDPIRFLRAREVVHYQRFGENLRLLTDKLNEKNFYAFNPSFDKKCFKNELKKKK